MEEGRLSLSSKFILLMVFLFIFPVVAYAIPIGMLSYDNFIPASDEGPGVDAFIIYNFTGEWSLLPDFPVTDALTLNNSSLTITFGDGNISNILLGDINPGYPNPLVDLQFPSTQTFLEADFSATISPTTFIANGSLFNAQSPTLTVSLLPSSGQFLITEDFVVLDLPVVPVSAVPEPATMLLLGVGLLSLLALKVKKGIRMR